MADREWHYVKPNETTRIPRRHIFMDSEACESRDGAVRRQEWRLAVARFVSMEPGRKPHDSQSTFKHSRALWEAVDGFTARRCRTVVWAHNLGYDARITQALTILPGMGWTLVSHNLASRGAWLQWRRDDRTLVMVDSVAIWAHPLETIGKWFGIGKVPLPDWEDSIAAWEIRCARDVDILSTAVLAYLDWLEKADLGNWQLTGAGQSWAAFRHRWLTHKLLVHNDSDALAAEREAMWTGRCEAYWKGVLPQETVEEWDLHLAYARAAGEVCVPTRLLGRMPQRFDWVSALDRPGIAILAEVDVTTATPVVPTRAQGRILWPVGSFRTTLWGPELSALLACGASVKLVRGWLYRATPALREWSDWIVGRLCAHDDDVPAWQKAVIKHWSRALIGRFAMTYQTWTEYGTVPTADAKRSTLYDTRTGQTSELLQVGTQIWESGAREEWDQSIPAITGYIMSTCRVKLWNIIQALPEGAVLYVDTDSVVTRLHHHRAVADIARSPIGVGLRLKRQYDGITIWGTRQMVTGNEVRIAGITKGAEQVEPGCFTGQKWESLGKAMRERRPTEVRIRDTRWKVRETDRRRGPGVGGWTVPLSLPVAI